MPSHPPPPPNLDYGSRTHGFPYACFACRKSFKRPWVTLARPWRLGKREAEAFTLTAHHFANTFSHRCPQCGGKTHFMGRDFKAPGSGDTKAWARVERFILSGRIYHHGISTDDVKWRFRLSNGYVILSDK